MITVLYKTKKALKDSVGKELRFQETSMYGPELIPNKSVPFVGPSASDRRFYGTVIVDDNYQVIRVK